MPFVASRTALVIACAFSCAAIATAADLREESRRAFDSYAEQATRAFLEHVRNAKSAGAGSAAGANATPRNGDVVVRPGREDGIMSVPGGLVHHWVGSTFISGVTLKDALEVSSRYDDYPSVYKPIVASTLLSHNENTYRVLMRNRGIGGRIQRRPRRDVASPVLPTGRPQRLQHLELRGDTGVAGCRNRQGTTTVARSRQRLSVARGRVHAHGRARWRRVRRDGDDRTVERFPALLSWIIEPIARRVGRSSVERSLQEFSAAVRKRSPA